MTTLSVELSIPPRGSAPPLEVAFDVPPGVTVLFGPSGAGKSRTLSAIAGLSPIERGRITLGEDVWFDAERRIALPVERRRIGYVLQSLALFPHMTALENVAYGLPPTLAAHERRTRALAMLERMHAAALADRRPATFSGGEAQRVALARAFAMAPRVVLLDEPFSALDRAVKSELLKELGEFLAEHRVPTVLVTHQPEDATSIGDRIVFVDKGRVVRTAPMSERPFDAGSERELNARA